MIGMGKFGWDSARSTSPCETRIFPGGGLLAGSTLFVLTLGLAGAVAGCAGGGAPTQAPGPVSAGAGGVDRPDPPSIHWVRTSAEYQAVFKQTYSRAAQVFIEQAANRPRGSWGVVIDADETVLDNSVYQQRRARAGLSYTPESWDDWVREAAAPALPGAVGFIERIREGGGRIFIVTNRNEEVCEPTRANLVAVGVDADAVLCRKPGEEGKEGRFQAVELGEAAPGVPAVAILGWVGDNILDFPGMSQEIWGSDPETFADFGARFFILPNPMYGSWQANPPRGR